MKVVIFDLDDTLYEELTFVCSGHLAVAEFLSPLLSIATPILFENLQKEFAKGRENVFNRLLEQYGKNNKFLIKKCLGVYRTHKPTIFLFDEAKKFLQENSQWIFYVVTDGNGFVQKNKCVALGLTKLVKKCVCTAFYGKNRGKPAPYCFEKICEWEKIAPDEAVYIADNPYKDFVGIKPLGFHTVRFLSGPYAKIVLESKYEAENTFSRFSELKNLLY